MSGVYLGLSFLCLFYFYHHPNHIGVVIHKTKRTDEAGFFMDSLGTNMTLSATQLQRNKRPATLYDIFKYKE
jgi:hypothetical protein